jgi:glycerophosphoryl diester phosphodiesterase
MEAMSFWNDLSWILDLRTPFLNTFFDLVSLAGYPTFLILFISFGYYYWSPEKFSRIAMLLFISGLINGFLKDYFQDPRPAMEFMLDPRIGDSYGWPSGHAQIAVTLWGLIAIEFKEKWLSYFCLLIIALISFSRMYLGVHDFGDIFAGLTIGAIVLGLWFLASFIKIYEIFSKKVWVLLILLSHFIYYFIYPSHINHEPSAWFLGLMMGWYLFSSNIYLNRSFIVNLITAGLSTLFVFFSMIFIGFLNNINELSGIFGELISYGLGLTLALIITWAIPNIWKSFKIA